MLRTPRTEHGNNKDVLHEIETKGSIIGSIRKKRHIMIELQHINRLKSVASNWFLILRTYIYLLVCLFISILFNNFVCNYQ